MFKERINKMLYNQYVWIAAALLLSVFTSNAVLCLVIGMAAAILIGNPIADKTGKASEKLLKTAVVLMGFGMSIGTMLKVGYASLWITFSSILITMVLGILYGRLFGIDRQIAVLVSSGTAICGASAVATMSPAIGATQAHTAIALAVVFILNALGLLIFPFLGHLLNLSPETFGLWAAISIHNTSSVVGAVNVYGGAAIAIGVTVKLVRALWIFPLAFIGARLTKSDTKPPVQWFLIAFLAAGIITSILPEYKDSWKFLSKAGKHLMAGTLFLVGSCLTIAELKKVGIKSFLMAAALWVSISIIAYTAVITGFWSIPADIFIER